MYFNAFIHVNYFKHGVYVLFNRCLIEFASVIHLVFIRGSGPGAALAAVIIDRSRSTVPHMGDTTSTHVEAGLVI